MPCQNGATATQSVVVKQGDELESYFEQAEARFKLVTDHYATYTKELVVERLHPKYRDGRASKKT